ncbi:hypothetical protein [Algoriphagus sp. AK58]|uniref:hypothetical protein n=1 Tax=Algoriphagus sp. AK58 TaxID=1406877 RepID=UPI00164F3DBA|nr:hypothetical protein [Algoriphagus sp. AK58]MBC6368019.1 hypothetical protein [Algoriphagus sp. AK58]
MGKSMKYQFLFIVFLMLLSCGESKMKDPEDVGKKTFNLLKKLNHIQIQEYINEFISLEQIRSLAKNNELITSEKGRNRLSSLLKDEFEEEIIRNFDYLTETGVAHEIIWKNIEFRDYVYEIEENDGLKLYNGKVFINHLGEVYFINVASIWVGDQFEIVEIRDLYEK